MNEDPHDTRIPDLTLGWRLRMSMEYANLTIQDMADELDVPRSTISRWMHDRVEPHPLFLRAWADITQISLDWLERAPRRASRRPKTVAPRPNRATNTGGDLLVTDNNDYLDPSWGLPDRPHPRICERRQSQLSGGHGGVVYHNSRPLSEQLYPLVGKAHVKCA